MKIGKEILELLGRKFRVEDWQFILCPTPEECIGYSPCLTRDRYSDTRIGLLISPDKADYIMIIYNPQLELWVKYKLTYLEYVPSQDMRNIKV